MSKHRRPILILAPIYAIADVAASNPDPWTQTAINIVAGALFLVGIDVYTSSLRDRK